MILTSSSLKKEDKFCTICRLILENMMDDFFLVGKRPETKAYAIVANVLEFYYSYGDRPITKQEIAKIVGRKSLAMYQKKPESKEQYRVFQKRIYDLLDKIKNNAHDFS
jgi:hypothetical protein